MIQPISHSSFRKCDSESSGIAGHVFCKCLHV